MGGALAEAEVLLEPQGAAEVGHEVLGEGSSERSGTAVGWFGAENEVDGRRLVVAGMHLEGS